MERIILFAKAPRRGEVKTRLAPPLSHDQALALYRAMLADQAAFVASLLGPAREGELCVAGVWPDGENLATAGLRRTDQGEGDLGARMGRAIGRALEDGAARVAIVGADAPTLPAGRVEEAFAALADGADVAITPAEDGGYVLVAASRPCATIFEGVAWGTADVLTATLARAAAAGARLAETEPWYDVDRAEDLSRLAIDLARDPARAPETRRALALYAGKDRVL